MAKQSLLASTAILVALMVALAIWLVIEIRSNAEGETTAAAGFGPGCTVAWSMMAGPGDWDPERMRSYMQNTLGTGGYETMAAHMRAHLDGEARELPGIDQDWHGMMDAMMRGWSRADWERCWGWMTDS